MARTYDLPEHPHVDEALRVGLENYLNRGIMPGSFLQGVLSNNLTKTLLTADTYNRERIEEIVRYVYDHLPSRAWGSREIMEQWCKDIREQMSRDARRDRQVF